MRNPIKILWRMCRTVVVDGYRYRRWHQTAISIAGRETVDGDAKIFYRLFPLFQEERFRPDKPTLVLLHGGLTSMSIWFPFLPALNTHFQLLCVDLRGQGKSTLGELPFTYRLLADDIFRVMDSLGIEQVSVAGWSDGGNIGLLMAKKASHRVRRLLTMGSNFHYDGLVSVVKSIDPSAHPPRVLTGLKWLYFLQSTHPKRWRELWHRVATLWLNYPQLSVNDLSGIKIPVCVVVAQFDLVRHSHARLMADYLPNGHLEIVKDSGHNLLFESPKKIQELLLAFL